MQAFTVTVAQSAVLLFRADADGSEVVLKNDHTHAINVGPSDVTNATGFPVDSGAALSFRLGANEAVYGITSSGSHDVRVLVVG